MQNQPAYLAGHSIKKMYIPSSPDMVIVNVDGKGAEMKTLCAYLQALGGGQELIHSFNSDPFFDVHSYYCTKIFGKKFGLKNEYTEDSFWDVYNYVVANKDDPNTVKPWRAITKNVVFGTLYGQGPGGLSKLINISFNEAIKIINDFFSSDKSIDNYIKWSKQFVATHGYINTFFGRRRRFPLVNADRRQKSAAQRKGTNFLIQSLCSDLVLGRMVEIDKVLKDALGGNLLITVHDSVVLEMPKQNLKKAKEFFNYWFTKRVAELHKNWFPVPFSCDIEVGPSYGELYDIDDYLADNFVETVKEKDKPDVRLLTEEDPDEISNEE